MNNDLFQSVDKCVLTMIKRASDEKSKATLEALIQAREYLLKAYLVAPHLI
jgi:hypothetical protein